MKLRDLHPSNFFLGAWQSVDQEATSYRWNNKAKITQDALLVAWIFCLVGASLILQEYLGGPKTFDGILDFIDSTPRGTVHTVLHFFVGWLRPEEGTLYQCLKSSDYYDLAVLCYWASWRVLGFLIIPLVFVVLHPRLGVADLGLSFDGFFEHLWVYVLLFTIVMIPVFYVSGLEEFASYYPFYRKAHRSFFDFAVWEGFYVAQFFSLEFFFRGFMLQPLRRIMGSSAIFAMMLPYVMIHIGKPMAECFGAIVAGIVLGTLAMRTRSIWGGFLIHVGIAVAMDLLALWQVHWR